MIYFIPRCRWGQFNTIIYCTVTATLGYFVLFVAVLSYDIHGYFHHTPVFLGLALVALGNGASAPCISSFVGDQMQPLVNNAKTLNQQAKAEHQVSSLYRWFYLSYNIGAIFGTIVIPILVQYRTYREAYGVLLFVALMALILFLLGGGVYHKIPPARLNLGSMLTPGSPDRTSLAAIFRVFLPLPIFWALFYNMPSLWTFSAMHLERRVGAYEIPAGQVTVLNPLFDILLIPVFEFFIYPSIEKCQGGPLRPLTRIVIGMLFTAIALIAAGVLETQVVRAAHLTAGTGARLISTTAATLSPMTSSAHGAAPTVVFLEEATAAAASKISVFWQVPQYIFMSVGEIMVSITALEYAYTQAPPKLKGVTMALFFFTQAIGNELVAVIALLHVGSAAAQYFFFAAVMVAFMLVFSFVNWSTLCSRPPPRQLMVTDPNEDDLLDESHDHEL